MEKVLIFQIKIKKLLVLNYAITHKTIKLKNKIKEYETVLSVISCGLT